MRTFGTQGPVNPRDNYVVTRVQETADFIERIKDGKYIVIFAPRQTGKTTFLRAALATLTTEDPSYFPIQLDFQIQRNAAPTAFYTQLAYMIRRQIQFVFQKRGTVLPEVLTQFLENTHLTDHFSMTTFFEQLGKLLGAHRVILFIDEFDGIPQAIVSDFLYALRYIYLSEEFHCPHSVGIVGVKNIRQLNYDDTISPFNIQDEFIVPNFTLEQVGELFAQYTDEVGQPFAPEVIQMLHKQTAGQPFLINRAAQILTTELDIPKTEPITIDHFTAAHRQLLEEGNTNIDHLLTNVRKDQRFEKILMRITAYDSGLVFNPDDPHINALVTYGVIKRGNDRMCEIVNPIYQHRILQTFKPTINGLESVYLPEDIDFTDYLSTTGQLEIAQLLDNFQDFIARAGFRILQVPDTPQEYVGQHLLYAYLDTFARIVGADMFLEVQTGRGRMDLLLLYNQRKYIVETKIWEGDRSYQAGKQQLAAYLKLEVVTEGYYVVFDHRQKPEPRVETETLAGVHIRSYVIPVIQTVPSNTR